MEPFIKMMCAKRKEQISRRHNSYLSRMQNNTKSIQNDTILNL